jgi:hypothetical protein
MSERNSSEDSPHVADDLSGSPAGQWATPDSGGRRRSGLWLGVGGVVVAAAVAVVLVLMFVVNPGDGSQAWTLTTPAQAADFPRVKVPALTRIFSGRMSEFKSLTNAKSRVAHISSTVIAVYNMGIPQNGGGIPVVFIGFNGTFAITGIPRMADNPVRGMLKVNAGPHGGTAKCGTYKSVHEMCYWITGTTMGFLLFASTVTDPVNALDVLMIEMRNDLERRSG